jgi:hypothetical protein
MGMTGLIWLEVRSLDPVQEKKKKKKKKIQIQIQGM